MTALALMTDEEVAAFRRSDAGFGAMQTARGLLPLIALGVRARVSGVIASTEVVQTFANTSGVAVEATYIFPLPDRAAVHRFRMEVNGRVVDGVVEERGAARARYDQAIATGHRAAIGEEERSGVFSLRVGNLMPGERATVTLSLVGALSVDDGEVTFQFPLVVAPRYIPGAPLGGEQAGLGSESDTDIVPDASRISPPVRLPGMPNPIRLSLEVAFDSVVSGVASSLHALDSASEHGRLVRVQPGERLDRDFILRWRADGDDLTSSLVCADDADGEGGTFALTLVPPSTRAVAQKPRDVVFVLDRSGSMEGWKMVAARRAVARMIDSLTSRDRFCAIAFDDRIEPLPGAQLADATDRARFRAVEQLAKIDARGGTELRDPLLVAADMLAGGYADRERVIVLVTDGQVGNEDDILRELAPRLRNVRVFTLGIDQAVNAGFLRRLAAAGAGLCEVVESEDRLDAVMAKVHHRIGAPIATELALRADAGFAVDEKSLAPARLPDVYAGAPVVVLGRYRGAAPANAAVELSGASLGEAYRARVVRGGASASAGAGGGGFAAASGPSSWLGACWARARIRDLEDRYAVGDSGCEREIVAVSERFGVLSRFTAFVAIDRSEVVNRGGHAAHVVQSVEPVAGWDQAAAKTRGMPAPMSSTMAMPMPAMAPMMPGGGGLMAPMPATPPGAPPVITAKDEASDVLVGGALAEMAAEEDAPDQVRAATVTRTRTLAMPGPASAPMPKRAAGAASVPTRPAPPKSAAYAQPAAYTQPVKGGADGESATGSAPVTSAAYRTSLAQLADELAKVSGAVALKMIRQRLTEWVEDVRSIGFDALAREVDALVARLAGAPDAAVVGEVAAELAKIAQRDDGGSGATRPKGLSRLAFWK